MGADSELERWSVASRVMQVEARGYRLAQAVRVVSGGRGAGRWFAMSWSTSMVRSNWKM